MHYKKSLLIKIYQNDVLVNTIVKTDNFIKFDDAEYCGIDFIIENFAETDDIDLEISIEDNSGNIYTETKILFDE